MNPFYIKELLINIYKYCDINDYSYLCRLNKKIYNLSFNLLYNIKDTEKQLITYNVDTFIRYIGFNIFLKSHSKNETQKLLNFIRNNISSQYNNKIINDFLFYKSFLFYDYLSSFDNNSSENLSFEDKIYLLEKFVPLNLRNFLSNSISTSKKLSKKEKEKYLNKYIKKVDWNFISLHYDDIDFIKYKKYIIWDKFFIFKENISKIDLWKILYSCYRELRKNDFFYIIKYNKLNKNQLDYIISNSIKKDITITNMIVYQQVSESFLEKYYKYIKNWEYVIDFQKISENFLKNHNWIFKKYLNPILRTQYISFDFIVNGYYNKEILLYQLTELSYNNDVLIKEILPNYETQFFNIYLFNELDWITIFKNLNGDEILNIIPYSIFERIMFVNRNSIELWTYISVLKNLNDNFIIKNIHNFSFKYLFSIQRSQNLLRNIINNKNYDINSLLIIKQKIDDSIIFECKDILLNNNDPLMIIKIIKNQKLSDETKMFIVNNNNRYLDEIYRYQYISLNFYNRTKHLVNNFSSLFYNVKNYNKQIFKI